MPKTKRSLPKSLTQISITLNKTLRDDIEAQAARENRNRSNFIANVLRQYLDEHH